MYQYLSESLEIISLQILLCNEKKYLNRNCKQDPRMDISMHFYRSWSSSINITLRLWSVDLCRTWAARVVISQEGCCTIHHTVKTQLDCLSVSAAASGLEATVRLSIPELLLHIISHLASPALVWFSPGENISECFLEHCGWHL